MARYELEPTLDDVYVEGLFDKEVLDIAYRHTNITPRPIYTADSVELSDAVHIKHNVTKGNKQKLILLCRELAAVNANGRVRFLVDRDTDHWFGPLEQGIGLVWTDYCDIETYFFEKELVRELIVDAGRAQVASWDEFYESFIAVLRQLFAIRLAARELELSVKFIDAKKCLRITGSAIEFDDRNFIIKSLNKSSLAAIGNSLCQSYDR